MLATCLIRADLVGKLMKTSSPQMKLYKEPDIELNNCRANYAKLLGQPISAPVRIQDRFMSSVWNFWRGIADVCLHVSHIVAGANERRLYSQARAPLFHDIHA